MEGNQEAGLLSSYSEDQKLNRLKNIEVKFTVEAGSSNIKVKDLLKLNIGSVIELDTLAGAHLNIRANGTLILKGEIVTIADILGVRITAVVTGDERSKDQI
jgi:flagellar motor switch protein FliN/FliY